MYGEIKVYDDSSKQQIASVQTDKRSLAGLETITFSPSFNTQKWLPNTYFTTATVWYDQKSKTDNASFMIGEQDITLLNYTRELYPGFSEFTILLRNNWGRELQNVYATISLNNSELLQTHVITLPPWSQEKIKGIVKVDLAPAQYPGKIIIYFEDKTKEVPLLITILPQEEKAATSFDVENSTLWISLLVLILIIIAIIGYFSWKKRS